jgi:hypothetical protein
MFVILLRTSSILTLLFTISFAIVAQNDTPKNTVASFYKFDRSNSQTFERKAIDARKGWFSPELYALFLKELEREKAYLKQQPTDKPFYGDGLPFQPFDEVCKEGKKNVHKQLTIGKQHEEEESATVKIVFAFPKPCKEPDPTEYTIRLVKSRNGWVIDNVIYSAESNLVKDLNRTDY